MGRGHLIAGLTDQKMLLIGGGSGGGGGGGDKWSCLLDIAMAYCCKFGDRQMFSQFFKQLFVLGHSCPTL